MITILTVIYNTNRRYVRRVLLFSISDIRLRFVSSVFLFQKWNILLVGMIPRSRWFQAALQVAANSNLSLSRCERGARFFGNSKRTLDHSGFFKEIVSNESENREFWMSPGLESPVVSFRSADAP
jgi:hypothetical protein